MQANYTPSFIYSAEALRRAGSESRTGIDSSVFEDAAFWAFPDVGFWEQLEV